MDEIKNNNEEMKVFENEKLIEDHEYDGIHELDNSPPPWLMGIWWVSFAFAIIFLLYYHVFGGPTQEEKYEKAMAEAAENMPEPEELVIPTAFLEEPADIEAGKEIWIAQCAVCHLEDGGGLVGPNMTDNYWVYEPTMESMYNTIAEGVIEKGMTPFKDALNTQQIHQVASFIHSLQGTTPANPKAAEGKEFN